MMVRKVSKTSRMNNSTYVLWLTPSKVNMVSVMVHHRTSKKHMKENKVTNENLKHLAKISCLCEDLEMINVALKKSEKV